MLTLTLEEMPKEPLALQPTPGGALSIARAPTSRSSFRVSADGTLTATVGPNVQSICS